MAGDGEREELPSFRPGPSAARGHAGRIVRRYDIAGHALNSGLCRVPAQNSKARIRRRRLIIPPTQLRPDTGIRDLNA